MGLTFSFTGFQILYSLLVIFLWTLAFLFSLEYMKQYSNKKRYYSSLFATLIATVCMFLANDLYTLFLFFEIISFASYVWVIFDKKKESLDAGKTYLAVAIISGMILLMGMFILNVELKTLNFTEIAALCKDGISTNVYIAGICLLLGLYTFIHKSSMLCI